MKSESAEGIPNEESGTQDSDIPGSPITFNITDIKLPHPQATKENTKTTQQNTFRILFGYKPNGHKGEKSFDPINRKMIWIKNPIAAKFGYKLDIQLMDNPHYMGPKREDIVRDYQKIIWYSNFYRDGCIEDPNVIIQAYLDLEALRKFNKNRPCPRGRTNGRTH